MNPPAGRRSRSSDTKAAAPALKRANNAAPEQRAEALVTDARWAEADGELTEARQLYAAAADAFNALAERLGSRQVYFRKRASESSACANRVANRT